MTTLKPESPKGKRLWFSRMGTKTWLMVELTDGRACGAPISLFPTLQRAPVASRLKFRKIGRGDGFHWPDLDLDLSVRGIVAGRGEMAKKPARKTA